MKHITVFGAGKSSTYLIDYLIAHLAANDWHLNLLDADESLAKSKIGIAAHASGHGIDVNNDIERKKWISSADIVISLLPPHLHHLLAYDCLALKKHLLTASYVDEHIKELEKEIRNSDLLFLCEMGLDPGIDHMSAMKIIDSLHQDNAEIVSFRSHCGGLVAPENDDNPWHYKISWNPRNVVQAGKTGAIFKENGELRMLSYRDVFNSVNMVSIPGLPDLAWYANRDSLAYIDTYSLQTAKTFLRTTLRYPSFIQTWKGIVEMGLTDESVKIDTDRLTLKDFFHRFPINDNFLAGQMRWIGYDDEKTVIGKGICSAADILQFALEQKLVLQPGDKDMVVMLHEIEYRKNEALNMVRSSLVVTGDDHTRTAMAKTVGLPLAIAAKLILEGKMKITGLHIPVIPEIYLPVLEELKQHHIAFSEVVIEQVAGRNA